MLKKEEEMCPRERFVKMLKRMLRDEEDVSRLNPPGPQPATPLTHDEDCPHTL